jgi:hypothetical protein
LDPCLLDEGPRPKGDKLRPNLHGNILEGKSISSNFFYFKKEVKRRAHDLRNQDEN